MEEEEEAVLEVEEDVTAVVVVCCLAALAALGADLKDGAVSVQYFEGQEPALVRLRSR